MGVEEHVDAAHEVLIDAQNDWNSLSDEEKYGAVDEAAYQLEESGLIEVAEGDDGDN